MCKVDNLRRENGGGKREEEPVGRYTVTYTLSRNIGLEIIEPVNGKERQTTIDQKTEAKRVSESDKEHHCSALVGRTIWK